MENSPDKILILHTYGKHTLDILSQSQRDYLWNVLLPTDVINSRQVSNNRDNVQSTVQSNQSKSFFIKIVMINLQSRVSCQKGPISHA